MWLKKDLEDEDEEGLQASYRAIQEEIKPMGLKVPDWDWLVADDDAEKDPPEKHQEDVQS